MATKQEILDTVIATCEQFNASNKLKDALTEILKPKSAGMAVNLDEVTKKNDKGEITHIQCSVSGVFLPATADFFYEDKAGKGINGLKRLSRQAEGIRKTHLRTVAASEKAIVQDILDGNVDNVKGKAMIEKLRASKPDFSTVSDKLPEPEAEAAE